MVMVFSGPGSIKIGSSLFLVSNNVLTASGPFSLLVFVGSQSSCAVAIPPPPPAAVWPLHLLAALYRGATCPIKAGLSSVPFP